ncbi:response regulator [Caballeronia sordidicola]|uniref:response regulator n=1 Tax=Caballeronia sordidicola TaxID=196367 RepID=UPI0035935918
MDIDMPLLSGHAVARQVRRTNKRVLLVAVTGNVATLARHAHAHAGSDFHLSKPADIGQLLRLAVQHLKRHAKWPQATHL